MLLQYPTGITFIAGVHDRLRYRSDRWTDSLFGLFDRILVCPPGYHLFTTILAETPPTLVVPVVRWVIERFLIDADPELTNLLCLIIRLFPDLGSEYQRVLSLPLYLSRPALSPVAVALVESSSPPDLRLFGSEIIANINGLLMAPGLIDILGAWLSIAPRAERTHAILQLQPRFEELARHGWAWRLLWTLVSVATMPQRAAVLQVIVGLVNTVSGLPHLDDLATQALDAVDAKARLRALEGIQQAVYRNPAFPRVNDYIAGLEAVLFDPDAAA
jgi:hypothetical protein